MARFVHTLRRAVLRPHIENGLSVAAGVALSGSIAGAGFGLLGGIAAATGALCVSVADQPDPLNEKPRVLVAAWVMAVVVTLLALFAKETPWTLAPATAAIGLWAGLISAYGKRALTLGVVSVLAFVMAMGSLDPPWPHLALFALGGALYAAYAQVSAWAFDRRVRRLLMIEALHRFEGFLRAKAGLLDPAIDNAKAFTALIEAHAACVERMQIARDAVYARDKTPWQRRQVIALIALLDGFETILSSDADIEMLRASQHRHLMRRLKAFTLALADDIAMLTLALDDGGVVVGSHKEARDEIAAEIARLAKASEGRADELLVIAAFRSTADKLAQAAERIAAIAAALLPTPALAPLPHPGVDLAAFRQALPRDFSVLQAQFSLKAPAMRYAIRLALAMTTGLAVTLFLPGISHASWVLLTTALIMRANYSVTRQRRTDRVIGTLIGCTVAAGLLAFVPTAYLLVLVAMAVGVSHAFGAVNYRVTAVAASISALLLLHFLQPGAHHVLAERVLDTLIGAALSYVFAFLLPNWEHQELPRTVAALLKADGDFARAALTRTRVEMVYRLARKRLFDAVANLSGAVRRLADEPDVERATLARLNDLLSANYLLLSDLTSMQVLFKLRGAELDAAQSDALLKEVCERVSETLGGKGDGKKASPRLGAATDLHQPNGMAVLKRRLVHIEHAARRVAQLAGG
ncbi:MAG: FUSC family membrane protein [Rhizomicrobium sp.]